MTAVHNSGYFEQSTQEMSLSNYRPDYVGSGPDIMTDGARN